MTTGATSSELNIVTAATYQANPAKTKVIVHPLVLLSVVDHFNRVAKRGARRVVGVLLGEIRKNKDGSVVYDASNTYAVPFEEERNDPNIWFLDHNYLENMYEMFRKVNARENIIGWYSSGPKLKQADLDVNELFRKYVPHPILVLVDVQASQDLEFPTNAYLSIEELKEGGTEPPKKLFQHVPSEIGAIEAEEVGVEHLLRDIKETSVGTVASQVNDKLVGLKSLISHLNDMHTYLEDVCSGKLPINHEILASVQNLMTLAPNLAIDNMAEGFKTKTNDMYLVIYLSSLIRSIIALHNLINNKADNEEAVKEGNEDEEEGEKKEGDADKKDSKDDKSKDSKDKAKDSKGS